MDMKTATEILSIKRPYPDGTIQEIHVWAVPSPVPPCGHSYKYSLFYGRPGERLIAYDNERGKGDHKHIMGAETPYVFVSVKQLVADFRADVLQHYGVKL